MYKKGESYFILAIRILKNNISSVNLIGTYACKTFNQFLSYIYPKAMSPAFFQILYFNGHIFIFS